MLMNVNVNVNVMNINGEHNTEHTTVAIVDSKHGKTCKILQHVQQIASMHNIINTSSVISWLM